MFSRRCKSISLLVAAVAALSACAGPDEPAGVPEAVIRENTLGTAYLGQQEWGPAADAFRRGLALREQDPLLLSNLAVALMQDGKPDEAETYLRQAIAIEPEHPHANYNLGLIESNRGNFDAASAHFEIVAAYDPDDVLTQYQLGIAYASLERGDDAAATLRRALEIDPDHVSSLYALGRELVKQGQRDAGRELIERSQAIRARSGLDTAVGSQYGEQGIYALGSDYPGEALAAAEGIDVSFALLQRYESAATPVWTLSRSAPDGAPVLIVADGARIGVLKHDDGFAAALAAHPDGGSILSLAAGDGDNDGIVELYALVGGAGVSPVLAVVEQSETGQFVWADPGLITEAIEFPDAITAADMVLVDREHDGDLDVFVCWAATANSGCAIATNDGAGNLALRPSTEYGFTVDLAAAESVHLTLSDIDNDQDIDLLVGETGGIHVLANQRDGNFSARVYRDIGVASLTDFALADIDKNGWMDAVVAGEAGLQLLRNRRGSLTDPVPLAGVSTPVNAVTIADADNDGFLDLVASTQDGNTGIYRNLGVGQWRAATEWVDATATPVAAFDADADGDLDLVSVAAGGVGLFENTGGNTNRWISVESRGIGDNRFGVGAKVEVLAGALRQKFEVTGPLAVHAGLGSREQVDSVRHLWPSGVLQDEVRLASGARVEVKQLDRKGTSCPILYVWHDGEWRFVTDFLGGSAVGYQAAPGIFSNPDTDEYVKLEHSPTADADGNLRLRVNNQLQEIIWYDKLELIAVDHPAGTELFPNERLMPGPPFPDFALFISDDIRPIVAARDIDSETEWTAELAHADRRYVENFENLRFKGYADTHTLELDLGPVDADARIVLLLDGWIDYADSTANVGAAQAGLSLMPPVLTVADGHGGWNETGHLMGFPAGLPKTMAVDLSGVFPSADHRIRIATNMRIYWDRARVMIGGSDIDHATHRIAPVSANLRDGGFPRETSRDGRQPFGYDPASVAMVSPWKAHVGRYTSFGEVTDLLDEIDDRMVMTRAGDEIELLFRSPGPVPAGHVRTFLMFADGFGKDMDPNSAANYLAGPMPFHGMPTYPYPEDVTPPVDLSDTLTRAVPDSGRYPPGAIPLSLAPVYRDDATTEQLLSARQDEITN